MNNSMERQHIGCEVTSCSYHGQGNKCELNKIMVRPCMNVNSQNASTETLCGSYESK